MDRFCSQCGTAIEPDANYCEKCGAAVKASNPVPVPPKASAVPKPEVPSPEPGTAPTGQKKAAKPSKKKNPKKDKKKTKKGKGCLVTLGVIALIAALIAFLVFAFGNYFTLRFHTDKVLDSLNSGNLDLSAFQSDPYEDLPLYVIEMMGETPDPAEVGPVVSAMTPYLAFERTEIHGFFGGNEVEYRIVSRDLSGWILSLDYDSITSAEQLQQMLLEYIPNAPQKEYFVTITYHKDGVFGWKGNYETPEFADAITGGLNTAYNALYDKMMEEMEAVLG